MARKIEVEIIGDSSRYQRALGQAQSKTSKFGAVAKTALIGGAAAGMYALAKAAKIGWEEYSQGQRVAAQTNAVIKSTGGLANVSAKHVEDLGRALMLKSGVDDEAIKSGENLLLTFRNIRNEVGQGNDIFDQATRATLDMATAMHMDMEPAAIAVGKAMNDPAKGLQRLTRMGVTFTDKQVALITRLQETGHTMEAQKVILQELRKEFGGSAKAAGDTLPGKLDILRERFRNFTGDLTERAIPALSKFVDFIDKVSKGRNMTIKLRTILSGAGTAFEQLLFGSPATRVKVPIEGGRIAWEFRGGGTGLVGAISKAIQDINWTAVGQQIARGVISAVNEAAPRIEKEGRSIFRDKFGLKWGDAVYEGVKKGLNNSFPNIAAAIKVFKKLGDGSEEAGAAIRTSMGGVKTTMGNTETVVRSRSAAMKEHLDLIGTGADRSRVDIEELRASVTSLRSKTIYVNAVVSGLGYVAALQEHLSLIHSQGVSVGVSARQHGGPVSRGTPYLVGERGPELFVPGAGGRIVANGGGGSMGSVNVIVVGGDRQAIRYFESLFGRHAKRNGG